MNFENDVFSVPLLGKYLLYAPLHQLVALVDSEALAQIGRGLCSNAASTNIEVQNIVDELRRPYSRPPDVTTGPVKNPIFLGIIPTRGCNMGCRYCDFAAPKKTSPIMSLDLARAAINGYLTLLRENDQSHAEIHFFGGEPFAAPEVVHFVIAHASQRAVQLGLSIRFEVTTNGFFDTDLCHWIADHFDTVVLSLDGPASVQDQFRPSLRGGGTFRTVARNAQILSHGAAGLIIRTCVASSTVDRLPEIAQMFGETLSPSVVCFESLVPTALSQSAGLAPPDPWSFAAKFDAAAQILAKQGIEAILSTADINAVRASLCPVGKDALIVSPDGNISACYALERDWQQKDMDMHVGNVDAKEQRLILRDESVRRVREYNVYHKPRCANCLCRYHCAGGCHLKHDTSTRSGNFDGLCIQTRLVTIASLLRQLEQGQLVETWFSDHRSLEESVQQASDRMLDRIVMTPK